MLDALRQTGWRNYTLSSTPMGRIGHRLRVEADLESALKGIGDQDVNRRWQAHMAGYFEVRPGPKPMNPWRNWSSFSHLD
jgi:L-rhamnose mutarotase